MPKDKYAGSDPDPSPFLFVSPEQKRADQVKIICHKLDRFVYLDQI